ncbi:hypothetical protein IVB46_37835 [Bradyrhizobium sp. 61]|uniref:hypothetical protein n=1 Tax=Bradyrhizobium sp. 61 TaxID=2782679 RepID=UPI001FF8DF91|nr:hypothetical protein [Bradyrhizobium sp. 61]MCK1281003.1 hypothetical protein [Bradyrhizobium sp. 61]
MKMGTTASPRRYDATFNFAQLLPRADVNVEDRPRPPLLLLFHLQPKRKDGLQGRSVRMEKLDELVTTHLTERLFQPERLATIDFIRRRDAYLSSAMSAFVRSITKEKIPTQEAAE